PPVSDLKHTGSIRVRADEDRNLLAVFSDAFYELIEFGIDVDRNPIGDTRANDLASLKPNFTVGDLLSKKRRLLGAIGQLLQRSAHRRNRPRPHAFAIL